MASLIFWPKINKLKVGQRKLLDLMNRHKAIPYRADKNWAYLKDFFLPPLPPCHHFFTPIHQQFLTIFWTIPLFYCRRLLWKGPEDVLCHKHLPWVRGTVNNLLFFDMKFYIVSKNSPLFFDYLNQNRSTQNFENSSIMFFFAAFTWNSSNDYWVLWSHPILWILW